MNEADGRKQEIRRIGEAKPEGWETGDFAYAVVCSQIIHGDAIPERLLSKQVWRTPGGERIAQDEWFRYAVRVARSRGLAVPVEGDNGVTRLRAMPEGAELAQRLAREAA
ncbi:MAG: hypothetical protein M3Q49_01600 [Actinomycetota bacterium]|nr:hypothetical protein [Actinomycetota bacterium]